MTEEKFIRLIEQYEHAWEEKNPDLAVDFFANDIEFAESPFESRAVGTESPKRYWKEATPHQTDINLSYSNMSLDADRGTLEWQCTYSKRATGARITLQGAMFFQFHGNRIKQSREYWHKIEE